MRPPLRGGRGGGGGFRGGGGGRGGGFGGRGGGGFGGRGGGGFRDEGPPEEVVGKPKSPHCCNPSASYVKVNGRESVLILYTWMIVHIACPSSRFPAFVAMSLCEFVILVMFVARIGDCLSVAPSGCNPPALHYPEAHAYKELMSKVLRDKVIGIQFYCCRLLCSVYKSWAYG